MKTGKMTNREGFFLCASHFSAGILDVFQGKMGQHRAKEPLLGRFDSFQIGPSLLMKRQRYIARMASTSSLSGMERIAPFLVVTR